MAYRSLRDFMAMLEREGELVRVKEPVSTVLEMTEIGTRLIAEGGPAGADLGHFQDRRDGLSDADEFALALEHRHEVPEGAVGHMCPLRSHRAAVTLAASTSVD